MMQIEAAFSRLERKLRQKKNESAVFCGVDGGSSCADRSGHTLYEEAGLHQGMVDLSVPAPSGGLVNSPFNAVQGAPSQVFSKTGITQFSKTFSTLDKGAYLIHSDWDSETCNAHVFEGKENYTGGERRKRIKKLYDGEKPHIPKLMCNNEGNSHSDYQWLEKIFLRQNKKIRRINAYLCNFCRKYYLFYGSYQSHVKDCLTCPQCSIKFVSAFHLHRHSIAKAHMSGLSKMCKLTQAQLRLHISQNEVLESDVKKMKESLNYTYKGKKTLTDSSSELTKT